MLDFAGAGHFAAVDIEDALVAEADAEHRDLARERADDVARDASIVRGAGAGRDNDAVGVERGAFFERDLVISMDDDILAQFAEVLVEVVGEAVVVVDHEGCHRSILSSVARSVATSRSAAASSSGG